MQDLDGVFIGRKRITANKAFIDGVLNELFSMCETKDSSVMRRRA